MHALYKRCLRALQRLKRISIHQRRSARQLKLIVQYQFRHSPPSPLSPSPSPPSPDLSGVRCLSLLESAAAGSPLPGRLLISLSKTSMFTALTSSPSSTQADFALSSFSSIAVQPSRAYPQRAHRLTPAGVRPRDAMPPAIADASPSLSPSDPARLVYSESDRHLHWQWQVALASMRIALPTFRPEGYTYVPDAEYEEYQRGLLALIQHRHRPAQQRPAASLRSPPPPQRSTPPSIAPSPPSPASPPPSARAGRRPSLLSHPAPSAR